MSLRGQGFLRSRQRIIPLAPTASPDTKLQRSLEAKGDPGAARAAEARIAWSQYCEATCADPGQRPSSIVQEQLAVDMERYRAEQERA